MRASLFSAVVLVAFASPAIAQTMPGEALLLLDGDKDSMVSLGEFSSRMDTLFEGIDTNKNGRLDRAEVQDFMADDVFKATDSNGNGSISKSEYDAQIRKDFENADKDGNGVLD